MKHRPFGVTNYTVNIIEDIRIEPNEFGDNFKMTIIYDRLKLSFPISIETKSNKPKSIQKEYSKFYAKSHLS